MKLKKLTEKILNTDDKRYLAACAGGLILAVGAIADTYYCGINQPVAYEYFTKGMPEKILPSINTAFQIGRLTLDEIGFFFFGTFGGAGLVGYLAEKVTDKIDEKYHLSSVL